jgi:REP element-mobilizing transposase RayT
VSASYCNLLYHIVFSTKGREPWLNADIRPRIHEYLGGAIRAEGGVPLIINGTADHVHILAKLRCRSWRAK